MNGKTAKLIRRVVRRVNSDGQVVPEAIVKRGWLKMNDRLRGAARKHDRKERAK